jgi:hypothetical protein
MWKYRKAAQLPSDDTLSKLSTKVFAKARDSFNKLLTNSQVLEELPATQFGDTPPAENVKTRIFRFLSWNDSDRTYRHEKKTFIGVVRLV